jgi:hypothetical protein
MAIKNNKLWQYVHTYIHTYRFIPEGVAETSQIRLIDIGQERVFLRYGAHRATTITERVTESTSMVLIPKYF